MISKISLIFLIISLSLKTNGQHYNTAVISGEFNNISFEEFVKKVEETTDFHFYYLPQWTKDIKVTFSQTEVQISDILNEQLKNTGIGFFIEYNNIYLFPGELITELPSQDSLQTTQKDEEEANEKPDSEKKYLDAKLIASTEVIVVGDKKKTVSGSNCVINGTLLDRSTLEPLIGATVYIYETKKGFVTDADGKFKLTLTPGKYKASFNFMSMKQQEYYLQVYSSGDINILMNKDLIELDEVSVYAEHHDNVKGMQMGFEKISGKTIKEIPVVMGERDILKVAQMLPGVQNVGEGTTGFNIRGSSADQNMFYINKIPVYNTSHLFGFFSAFNPDVINDFTLYKSNIPASYGGRIASIFDITTRQGSKKKFFGQGGISPVTGHCSFEIPVIKDKTSLVTSWRSTYSNWILKNIKDGDIRNSKAFFYDFCLGVNTEINSNNMLKVFGYNSNDNFSLSSKNDYSYSNKGASLIYKHLFSSSLAADITAVISQYSFENTDKNNASAAFTQNYNIDHYEAKIDFSYKTNFNHKFEFGISDILYNLNRGEMLPYGEESIRIPFNFGKERGLEGALYISDEFSLLKNLSFMGGIRYSYFMQLGPADVNKYFPENSKSADGIVETKSYNKGKIIKFYSGPEYRAAVNYTINPNQSVKASYNRLYQYMFMLSNTIAISPDDKWKICDYNISPPRADQISLGYYQNFRNKGITISLEVYHKKINNQVEYKDGTDFFSPNPIETQILQGKQDVNGMEIMINKNIKKITGWISYSYSRSFIKVNSNLKENQINYGIKYPSNYDRPHSLNLVMNYRVNRRLSLSSNFVYATGRPITYPTSIYYTEGQQLTHFSKRNEYRLPDYARMDLSINLEGNLKKRKFIHSYFMINLYNVLGRRNAYSAYFQEEEGKVQGYKLSIFAMPIFTISWNYKFGNYLND